MEEVAHHYTVGELGETILAALSKEGKDLDALTPEDLAPVDGFHIRGREATEELAKLLETGNVERILDVGSGLGGSCRFLAARFECETVGVDLTEEYCRVAEMLSDRVGLGRHTKFKQGSALDLPFPDESFDLVWTEHVQMNIEDKARFYGETARVLAPGGRLAFHDIFAGEQSPIHFPVPWAPDASISFLMDPVELRKTLQQTGLREISWQDTSAISLDWFQAGIARIQTDGPQALGIHLLMGKTAFEKLKNVIRNLNERRITVIQAVMEKPGA